MDSDAEMPAPLRVTICGLPVALSVMVMAAVRLPAAPGVKLTLMVQLAPAATEVPQVSVWAKSPVLVPVTAMLETLSAPAPLLVRVTVCAVAEIGRASCREIELVAVNTTVGEEIKPERLRLIDSGRDVALSVMASAADRSQAE